MDSVYAVGTPLTNQSITHLYFLLIAQPYLVQQEHVGKLEEELQDLQRLRPRGPAHVRVLGVVKQNLYVCVRCEGLAHAYICMHAFKGIHVRTWCVVKVTAAPNGSPNSRCSALARADSGRAGARGCLAAAAAAIDAIPAAAVGPAGRRCRAACWAALPGPSSLDCVWGEGLIGRVS